MIAATTQQILAVAEPQVIAEEGFKDQAYQDTLGVWTIGFGRTGSDVYRGVTTTLARERVFLTQKLNALCDDLDFHVSWWRGLGAVRAAVVLEMAYQMGVSGVLGFKTFLALAQQGKFAAAAADGLATEWDRETPARAQREMKQFSTGVVA